MKKFLDIIVLSLVLLGAVSCSEDQIHTYKGERYLYFSSQDEAAKEWIDSLTTSFKFHPGETSLKYWFKVNLVGGVPSSNITYNVAIVDSLTTAAVNSYSFNKSQVFRAGNIIDSMLVTIHLTEDLNEVLEEGVVKDKVVAFSIQPSADFAGGLPGKRHQRLFFNNVLSRPTWWNKACEKSLLGAYSDEKYTQFIICTGISDMSTLSNDWKRYYSLQFKDYVEENSLDMEIPVI